MSAAANTTKQRVVNATREKVKPINVQCNTRGKLGSLHGSRSSACCFWIFLYTFLVEQLVGFSADGASKKLVVSALRHWSLVVKISTEWKNRECWRKYIEMVIMASIITESFCNQITKALK